MGSVLFDGVGEEGLRVFFRDLAAEEGDDGDLAAQQVDCVCLCFVAQPRTREPGEVERAIGADERRGSAPSLTPVRADRVEIVEVSPRGFLDDGLARGEPVVARGEPVARLAPAGRGGGGRGGDADREGEVG